MKYTLLPDSRRPGVCLVCDEDGQPIEYPDGQYQRLWPFGYVPSTQEKELRQEITRQFPKYEIMGISPKPRIGRFEARSFDFQLVGSF